MNSRRTAANISRRDGAYRARRAISVLTGALLLITAASISTFAQTSVSHDPAEPQQEAAKPKIWPRPAGAVVRAKVDEKSMRALINQLVACGTRLLIAPRADPKRGPGCGRDHIAARLNEIFEETGGKLQVVVDKFEGTSVRTSNKPAPMENVYAILPGTDDKLSKTVFLVSGHFDSRPSDVARAGASILSWNPPAKPC